MSEMKTLKFPGDTEPREIVDAKAREDISKLLSGGISTTAKNLLITILRSGVYTADQSANITALDTALGGDAYRMLKALGLAKNISNQEVRPYYYKPLKDMINEVFLNLLDGQKKTYSRDDTYYKLVMAVVSIPYKIKGDSEDFKELINLGDYILTGGDINNQSATI